MARRSKTAGITADRAGNKTIDKIFLKKRVFARLGPVSQSYRGLVIASPPADARGPEGLKPISCRRWRPSEADARGLAKQRSRHFIKTMLD